MGCVPGGVLDLDDTGVGVLWVGEPLELRNPWQELGNDVERRIAVAGRDDDAVEALERAHPADAVAVLEGDVRDAGDARGAEDLGAEIGWISRWVKKQYRQRSGRTTTRGSAGQSRRKA